MDRKKFLLILAVTLAITAFLVVAKLFIFDLAAANYAAIQIDTIPKSTVFLNDKEVGQTPFYSEKLVSGEYKIKLGTWETKLKLPGKTLTYVSRNLGLSPDQSSGQILVLEKLSFDKVSELAIVSNPDSANVQFDGLNKGSTSLILQELSPGDHELIISQPGYSDQSVKAKTIAGYRLNVQVQLAKLSSNQSTSSASRPTSDLVSSSSGEPLKPYVVIKDTPTGFLRVRTEASISASESGQVNPGEKYPLLSEVDGWVKIKLPGIFGWVSDAYVNKIK